MSVKCLFVVLCLIILANSAPTKDCQEEHFLSCLQEKVYRTLKTHFSGMTNREGEQLDANPDKIDARIMAEGEADSRQTELQDYTLSVVRSFWKGEERPWTTGKTGRAEAETLTARNSPGGDKDIPGHGRDKVKRPLRLMLPLLIALKLKLAALGALGYMLVAFIAKKAIVAGIVSLLVSGFIAAKNLIESLQTHPGFPGFQTYALPSGWGPHPPHPAPGWPSPVSARMQENADEDDLAPGRSRRQMALRKHEQKVN